MTVVLTLITVLAPLVLPWAARNASAPEGRLRRLERLAALRAALEKDGEKLDPEISELIAEVKTDHAQSHARKREYVRKFFTAGFVLIILLLVFSLGIGQYVQSLIPEQGTDEWYLITDEEIERIRRLNGWAMASIIFTAVCSVLLSGAWGFYRYRTRGKR